MSDFVHLHCHSTFSALDGVATPTEYFQTCAERGYVAHALTEHGNMASVPDAYWASQDTGVKMIAGCELYYNDYEEKRRKLEASGQKVRSMEDEVARSRMIKQRHLTVLCKTMNGYRNLLSIRKASYDYVYYKPRANIKMLYEFKEDLLILSGCM
ncbi:MAG: PHP domain-containing protein, partial [Promethearchaeota archaeon]